MRTDRSNLTTGARAAALLLATAGASHAIAQCPPTFNSAAWGVGGSPSQTVVGDFNNDGKLDLASPNFSGSNITIRWAASGAAAGSNYSSGITLPVGLNPRTMVAVDINQDGVDDLVVAYQNGGAPRIGVYISNGNGTFRTMANYVPSPITMAIMSADVTRDGVPDIVGLGTNTLLVLPGGPGAWTGGGAEAFSTRPVTTAAGSFYTVADTNADGSLDVVSCQGDPGRVFLALATAPASASFGPAAQYGSGYYGTSSPASGDFNGDGIEDIVVGHTIGNSRIQVFLGNTGGTLTPLPVVVPGNAQPKSLATADFNGDGLLDVALVHAGGVGVHMGDGAGGLGSSTNYALNQLSSLTIADMNNDGRPDIIAGSQTLGTFTVMLNTTPSTTYTLLPPDRSVCPGGNAAATFTARAETTQAGGITGYRWERLTGGVWQQLTAGTLAGVGNISFAGGTGGDPSSLFVANVQGNQGDTVMTVRAVALTVCGGHPTPPVALKIIRPCGGADIGATGGVASPCGDGVLDNNDFVVFIDYFFNGNTIADVGSTGGLPGGDGRFDNNDFVVFIDMFFGGCTL